MTTVSTVDSAHREPAKHRRESSELAAEMYSLSKGNVIDIPPSGPVFAEHTRSRRTIQPGTFIPALNARDRVLVAVLGLGWIGALASFWSWWLQGEHRVTWFGMIVNSVLLLYLSSQAIYFMVAANRLREIDPLAPIPHLRVAFVVTRAPSEPWHVAEATLRAMLTQQFPYPYDVWLCDEQPGEYRSWCAEQGVRISSRYDVPAYHRNAWPRRTKCKEGNLAYFYDRFGYRDYDVVVQLDCDHVPTPTYLAEMVRPFGDPAIGYVAAPSICDANAKNSWAARGRLNWEGTFHGPGQLGHNDGLAPVCIGSHYAVRTDALCEIGGVGPQLAEDFSTSFLMNSAGWHGAFAIAAEAHGDGPLTFSDMVTQEFQWSQSLTSVLLRLVPRHLGRLGWWLRVRFLYSLLHYVLLASVTVCGLLLPPIAAVTGVGWMSVNYAEFLFRWWSVSLWLVLLAWFLRRRGLLRPVNTPILSWEKWLYVLIRWPYTMKGVVRAFADELRPRAVTFKVTPKSLSGLTCLPAVLIAPYVTISLTLGLAALTGELLTTRTVGYVFLCLLGSLTYLVVSFAVCGVHALEASRRAGVRLRMAVTETTARALALSALTVPVFVLAALLFPRYAIDIVGW